jgi:hypothetical protein
LQFQSGMFQLRCRQVRYPGDGRVVTHDGVDHRCIAPGFNREVNTLGRLEDPLPDVAACHASTRFIRPNYRTVTNRRQNRLSSGVKLS